MNIPYVDFSFQWDRIKDPFLKELPDIFVNSSFCQGPAVKKFEEYFANYIGTKYALGVNSGTSALHIALLAAGIKSGDEVLIPTFTFIATAWAAVYIGAKPIFCDVDPHSYNIDLDDAQSKITAKTKAIIPVHLYGQSANMDEVLKFAKAHNLLVIEDAAQAHGALHNNKRVGSFGKMGCFSFYPSKNLGGAGEGGMITTNDDALALHIKSLRSHGEVTRYIHDEIGYNYRMDSIQGLFLSHKLQYLDEWNRARKEIAKSYIEKLKGQPVILPHRVGDDHIYNLFVIQAENRDALREFLTKNLVDTGIHYPIPLHAQPCFKHLYAGVIKNADDISKKCISLPIFPGMKEEQIQRVADLITRFFNG